MGVAMSAPVFDGKNRKRFPKIALQCDAMKESGIVRSRIGSGIVEGGEIIFEPSSNPLACILERFINIGDELSSDRGQAGTILAPDSQSVTIVGAGQPLVNQPDVQERGR